MDIRRVVEGDLSDYKALRDQVLARHPTAFTSDVSESRQRSPESYRSRLGTAAPDGGEFLLGAWKGACLIGAIGCERDARVKARHVGQIVGMMVDDDWRGQGVGRALLLACIALARAAQGLEMLTLTVTVGNAPATGLYRRLGFVRYGTQPRAIRVAGRYHDKDQMALVL